MPIECAVKPKQRELADSIVRLANPEDLRILLACGAKVNETVTQGLRPLHYSVWRQYREATLLLLARGCDINAVDETGCSAMHLAAEHGYIEMLEILLEHGAKTDYRHLEEHELFPRTTVCEEPLRLSIKNDHYEVAQILLAHGANPNARYFFGGEINLISPLDVQYLELLLRYGANPDTIDRSGFTPLMKACRLPHLEAVLCLISHGANVNGMTDERHDYRTVLHYAVISCVAGNYDVVDLLLKQGARVNLCLDTPSPLDLAILKGDVTLVKMLIDAGANLNASSPIIGSPLHVACAENIPNRLVIMQLLLERGSNPNIMVTSDDGTPLKPCLGEYICSNPVVDKRIVNLLMRYGAKVIMKSQFRDPRGILNYLQNIGNHKELMMIILDAAESFDPPLIRRCASLTSELKTVALTKSKNASSLKHQCRLYIRKILGQKLPSKVQELWLPQTLESYLLFDE